MKNSVSIAALVFLSMATNAYSANQDAIDYINKQTVNYADVDYYSFKIKGCQIQINTNTKSYSLVRTVNAQKLNWGLTGRNMSFTQAHPSGDLYVHSLVCSNSENCINSISSTGDKSSLSEMTTFSITNNPNFGERLNQAFVALIKSCGGSGRGF